MEKTREVYTSAIRAGIEQRSAVEAAVKSIFKKGCDSVYLVGCGGSLAVMEPMRYFIQRFSKLPVYSFNSNEFVHAKPQSFGAKSVYITSSYTGTTPETVAAAQYAKECGAHIIAFTTHMDSPLAQVSDYAFTCASKLVIMYQIIFYLLHLNGDFDQYEQLQQTFTQLPDQMYDAMLAAQPRAEAFAKTYRDEKFFFVTGSGAAYGECYTFGNCLLEEMLWIYAHPVHAGEFFHGAFEMLTEDSPIIVVEGEDATRPLSERVLSFAKHYTQKIIHVDSADYKEQTSCVSGELMREVFTPFILGEVLRVYAYEMSLALDHPLSTRRYMFKVEY